MRKKIKIVSLFSGCGGLDLGFTGGFSFLGHDFERLNTEIAFANDFDADAQVCYNSNPLLTNDGAQCLLEDIRNVDANQIPNFDVLLAGFPCQPFSNAGNRKGVNDANGRGTLFEECERIIRAKIENGHRPQAFVFENVRGILSSKMSDGVTTVPQEISNRMRDMGYNTSMQLVCASDYGVPQQRYRVIIIGIDAELNIGHFDFNNLQQVVHDYQIPSKSFGREEELLLGYILQGVHQIQNDVVWEYSETTQRTVELIGGCRHGMQAFDYFTPGFNKEDLPEIVFEGRSWKDIPYQLLSPRFKKIADDPKRYHAPKFFRRFAFGEINGTITASAQPENCGITHPVENRRYSVRECARIQSFPDNFSFNGIPLQSQYKVIGNAVPPILGWVIAKALLNVLPE
jgi:DNA (cytosine-5)-methyltransferase 1